MDDFATLSNRLLSRCPAAGIVLAEQFVNDAWHGLQARREWSWRRKSATFAPVNQYITGTAAVDGAGGDPTLVTITGGVIDASWINRQVRIGGYSREWFTISEWIDATHFRIDRPWNGPAETAAVYQIIQLYFSVPDDFGYFVPNTIISPKDGYRLWTTVTQAELGVYDPQRTTQGQTYAVVFKDYWGARGGTVGAAVPVTSPTSPSPVSATSLGYTGVAPATYIVQVVAGGISGAATFRWMRAGQSAFGPAQVTQNFAIDLDQGVQIYWPDVLVYVASDLFVIQATPGTASSGLAARYELWPSPTSNLYSYPYMYITRETDLTAASPSLPPGVGARGEVLLELALEKCATFPGADKDHPNPYFNLNLAKWHAARAADLLVDLERNDEEIGVTNISYDSLPLAPAPWLDGSWRQRHAPWL